MGDSIRLDLSFRGITGVVANFRSADKRLQREVRKAVKEAGAFCKDLAYFLSPVDTEHMRDHLQTVYSPDGLVFETGWDEKDFRVPGRPIFPADNHSFYPIYQEFGTKKMAAQPSLGPAYQDTKAMFSRDISAAVRRSLKRSR